MKDDFSRSDLEEFVQEALDFGWPDNTVPREDPEFPNFWNTRYTREDWRYLDLWSGSSTDAGVQFVFYRERPVWTCMYRGGLLRPDDLADLSMEGNAPFRFLIRALRQKRAGELPIRGPLVFTEDEFTYRLEPSGDFTSFSASESITISGETVYERLLVGGVFGDGVLYGGQLTS